MMGSIPERIATLEANETTNNKAITDITTTLHSLDEKVGRIEIRVEKSMSFIGGIAFTFSALGAVFVFAAQYILAKIGVHI